MRRGTTHKNQRVGSETMQYIKSTILAAFDKDAFYTISDLLTFLPLRYGLKLLDIQERHLSISFSSA